ncbi:MAG: MtrB/PioB family decaheme-associated outer membrane protein [Pseudomonadota bacterium]|nr:MAG: MtrB/PioB family decaheme-associated outer membrane protein [Pseudomonadota bacterium]
MTTTPRLIMMFALAAPAAVASAQEQAAPAAPPAVDTSEWVCKFCAFPKGWSGEFELGAAYVSDDSYKFSEYTGLEKGGYAVGNATARYNDAEKATYWDLYATDLGFPYRAIEVEGGKQGTYKLFLKYSELPHNISDSARTPFGGTGGDSLVLPPGWVRAGSTGGMTALSSSLQDVNIDSTRKRVGLGLTLPVRDWEYGLNAKHETREGTKRMAGAFLFSGAQFVAPVDYTTDDLEAAASYAGRKTQVKFAYQYSAFRNSNDALTWQNPFTALFTGADAGQLALPPDNQFHQLLASAGYQFTDATRGTATLAVGRAEQDESFVAPSVNPNFAAVSPPRNSLQGRVDTVNADLKLVSSVTDKLRLDAAYTYNDRKNKTPQDTFNWVSTDSVLATPRVNLPYSFTRNLVKLAADYRLAAREKVAAGVDYDMYERTYQEVDKTTEGTLWAKYTIRAADSSDLSFKVAHAKRDGDNYEPVAEISPPENPLMRKYNMADRTRDTIGLRTTGVVGERMTLGFGIDYAADDYSSSSVGLLNSEDWNFSGDLSVLLTKNTTFHAFANYQTIHSQQAGASSFVNPPDWYASNDDVIGTVGVGVKRKTLGGKLDLGADYAASRSRGKTTITGGGAGFPDITAQLNSLKLSGTYRFSNTLSLAAAYWYESYRSQDWQLDGVNPSTIPNVLSLGESSPHYNVNFISLSLRYKF